MEHETKETLPEELMRQFKEFLEALPPQNRAATALVDQLVSETLPYLVEIIHDIALAWRTTASSWRQTNFEQRLARIQQVMAALPNVTVDEAMSISGDYREESDKDTGLAPHYMQLTTLALEAFKYALGTPSTAPVPIPVSEHLPPPPAASGPVSAYDVKHAPVYNTFRAIPLADTLAKALAFQTESAEASNRLGALLELVANAVAHDDHTVRVVVMPHVTEPGEGVIP